MIKLILFLLLLIIVIAFSIMACFITDNKEQRPATPKKVTKGFLKMSPNQVQALTEEEFNAVPPEEKRSCYDCGHIRGVMSLWCTSKDAITARGTSLPGCIKCPYWKPEKK